MKIPPRDIARFLKSPPPDMRLVLVYGPDQGMVRERIRALAKTVVDDMQDPFRVALLDDHKLRDDPAALADEAAQIAMMGGRRVVLVRTQQPQSILKAVTSFLDQPSGDALVLIQAGDLPAKDKLRHACEAQKQIAATLACYQDDAASLGRLLDEIFRRDDIRTDPQTRGYILDHLGVDHGISRQEIEKLALYAGPGQELDLDMVREALGNSAQSQIDEMLDLVLLGQWEKADRILEELWGEGTSPITILRIMQSRISRLHRLTTQVEAGLMARQAIEKFKPPIFFKQVPLVENQLRLWTSRKLMTARGWLLVAEAECKKSLRPDKALTGRCLMQICWAAKPSN